MSNIEILAPDDLEFDQYLDSAQDLLDTYADEIQQRCFNIKKQIYEIGEYLYKAKKTVKHGKFKEWIADNFDFSYGTARNMMRVYMNCMGSPEIVDHFKSSVLYTICANGFPEEYRTQLFNNFPASINLTNKEVTAMALKYQKGEIKITDEECQKSLANYTINQEKEYCQKELKRIKSLLKKECTTLENGPEFNNALVKGKLAKNYKSLTQKKLENVISELEQFIKNDLEKEI